MKYMVFLLVILFSCRSRQYNHSTHIGKHRFKEINAGDTLINFNTSPYRMAEINILECVKYKCEARDTFYIYK